MGNLQPNLTSSVAIWPHGLPAFAPGRRTGHRRSAPETQGKEPIGASGEARTEAAPEVAEEERRRAYNREYMRIWRKRNQERYRVYNREYQRKRHIERKVARILSEQAKDEKLCGYGCGRPAVETIERTDPRTWKTVQIAYCGHC